MSRDEMMYLRDIAQSCRKVLQFTEGLTQNALLRDGKTYDAVVRNLEIIGEDANSNSPEITNGRTRIAKNEFM